MAKSAKDLRIVFMGTPEFASTSLKRLVAEGYNIVAVVTTPDKPAGRGQKIHESDVKLTAKELGLPILQPEKLRDEVFLDELRALNVDLGIVIAFRMLPEVVWSMPPMGTFNLHASLLPQYRGAAPINWAIINGEERTGVTTFLLNHEIDKGAIIEQESLDILPEDNIGTLYDKLMNIGSELVLRTVDKIAEGNYTVIEQMHIDESTLRPAPKIFKEDGLINWDRNGRDVINLYVASRHIQQPGLQSTRMARSRARQRYSQHASRPMVSRARWAMWLPTRRHISVCVWQMAWYISTSCSLRARNE